MQGIVQAMGAGGITQVERVAGGGLRTAGPGRVASGHMWLFSLN